MGIAAVCAALLWLSFQAYTGMQLEDAFITYRYAENLASGRGFVFNPGERVMGTTTPLYTVILAGAGMLFGTKAIPTCSKVALVLASVGTALCTYRLFRVLGYPAGLAMFGFAVFCLHASVLWSTAGGMETPMVLLLMAASALAAARGCYGWAGLWLSVLVMTRIDGAIWATGVLWVVRTRQLGGFWRAVTIGLTGILPYVVLATWYFGSAIPHSLIAKAYIGESQESISVGRVLSYIRWASAATFAGWPLGAYAGVGSFALGAVAVTRQPRDGLCAWLVVFPLALGTIFCLGHAPRFAWYFVPAVWCTIVVGSIGVWWGMSWILGGTRVVEGRSVLLMLCVGVLVGGGCHAAREARFQKSVQMNETGTRKVLGEWLRENTEEDAVVAMEAVGYQAYFSDRAVIDLAGLVSPRVVSFRRAASSNGEVFCRVMAELKPSHVVLRSFEVEENRHYHGGRLFETTTQERYFHEHYAEAKRFVAPIEELWGERGKLTVFARRAEARDATSGARSTGSGVSLAPDPCRG